MSVDKLSLRPDDLFPRHMMPDVPDKYLYCPPKQNSLVIDFEDDEYLSKLSSLYQTLIFSMCMSWCRYGSGSPPAGMEEHDLSMVGLRAFERDQSVKDRFTEIDQRIKGHLHLVTISSLRYLMKGKYSDQIREKMDLSRVYGRFISDKEFILYNT